MYVDDPLISGQRCINDALVRVVQKIWKMSAPEHLGPDADSVQLLIFLGVKLRE